MNVTCEIGNSDELDVTCAIGATVQTLIDSDFFGTVGSNVSFFVNGNLVQRNHALNNGDVVSYQAKSGTQAN